MNLSKNRAVIIFSWVVGVLVASLVFGPSIIESLKGATETKDLRPELEQGIKQNNATMNDFIEKNSAPSLTEKTPN